MSKKRLLVTAILVVCVIASSMLLLVACKPGYKEVWKPIADYNYDWEDNGDLEKIIERVNLSCIAENNAERAKFAEDNAIRVANGDKPLTDPMDPNHILSLIQEDGSFSNIEYDYDKEDKWPPLDHLKNILYLQVARFDKDSPYYNSDDVSAAVTKTIKNWIENKYYCTWNWWFNDIGVGMYLPNILLFGVDGITDAERDELLANLEKTMLNKKPMRFNLYERNCNEAGGNLADQALSGLKYYLARHDGNTIMWITKQIENELRVFPPYVGPTRHRWDAEGIKEDWSFQQHDQLLYYGGYGEVMLDGFNEYIRYTSGTQFAISDEKLEFYGDFVVNGVQFATRGGYRDISASGRGASRRNGLKGIAKQVRETLELLVEEGIRVDECTKVLEDRFGETDKGAGGHRFFYESDYQVMNNERYMASVRHASERTRVFEFLNGENPNAYYTGLGATFYYVDGDEYFNMPVVFDWNKIPGTTTRQGYIPTMNQDFSYNEYGCTEYAQGVSNGKVGASYIRSNTKGLSARKAYFMFEDGVVCLGSDIHTLLSNEIVTNVNQARLDGDVIVGQNGTTANATNGMKGKFDYVYHDKIAYFTDAEMSITIESREGDWKAQNLKNKYSYYQSVDAFGLDISHGRRPQGAKYAYTVLMNVTPEESAAYAANPTLKVLANERQLQAVYDAKNDIAEAVFHRGGTLVLSDGAELKISDGAVVIVEKVDGKVRLTIASHDYESRDVEISYNGVAKTATIGKRPIVVEF